MTDAALAARNLIDRSISHTEIAHADYSPELAAAIEGLDDAEVARWEAAEGPDAPTPWCVGLENSVDAGRCVEYWGTTSDGNEWRVHLDRTEARS